MPKDSKPKRWKSASQATTDIPGDAKSRRKSDPKRATSLETPKPKFEPETTGFTLTYAKKWNGDSVHLLPAEAKKMDDFKGLVGKGWNPFHAAEHLYCKIDRINGEPASIKNKLHELKIGAAKRLFFRVDDESNAVSFEYVGHTRGHAF